MDARTGSPLHTAGASDSSSASAASEAAPAVSAQAVLPWRIARGGSAAARNGSRHTKAMLIKPFPDENPLLAALRLIPRAAQAPGN